MMNSILDFRTLLKMIYVGFGTKEFTSRELSDLLRRTIKPCAQLHPNLSRFYSRVDKKLISNDLRRLYAMGFLKKRRVKRKVKTKSGKTCYRGYEYRYSLSSQALKYLEYLEKGGQEEGFEELADLIVKIIIEKRVPEEDRDSWWEFYQTQVKEKKGFRRFSTSQRAFWEKVVEKIVVAFRDKRIKSLEEKVKLLERENEELRKKLKENEKYKEIVKRANKVLEELTSMLPE
ncbi:hypothetical protein [Thermococcus sp. LS2]|uniref:hypothetical protein n=1 Tax=Thermococcus sp. LS2 TaxID=1638260 RepID=UPI00143CA3D2|nr:hypothetical protein [Thermococcus sp. LS2]NJE12852.1 hypothetical protein [Thermococcus sp. LS2]